MCMHPVNVACINNPLSAHTMQVVSAIHPSLARLLACAEQSTAALPPSKRVTSLPELRARLGWSPARLTNYKSRGLSKEAALQGEQLFNCSSSWLLNGGSAEPVWIERQHLHAGESHALYAVAHGMSHLTLQAVPFLSGEQLMRDEVPETFRAVVADDAMAPEFPMGTELLWTTRRRIQPGRLLLIRDSHHRVHVRRCHQGADPDHWIGAPANPAFATFTSRDVGVAVLAVFKGRLEPDDE